MIHTLLAVALMGVTATLGLLFVIGLTTVETNDDFWGEP